jgi:hypothetical protein
MSNKVDNRRWELIFKEINNTITSEEQVELDKLQKEVLGKTKLMNRIKSSLVDTESY